MKEWIQHTAKKENRCIFITSHDLDFIEQVCDRVIIIHEGKIVSEGAVDEMKQNFSTKKTIHLYFNDDLDSKIISKLENMTQGVHTSENGNIKLTVRTEDLSILFPTFAYLKNTGLRLTDMSCSQDTLEDIFIEMTESKGK
jgi:ABC-2 type transport system ATP-binding protein